MAVFSSCIRSSTPWGLSLLKHAPNHTYNNTGSWMGRCFTIYYSHREIYCLHLPLSNEPSQFAMAATHIALGRLSRNRNISLSELEMAILNNEQLHEWKKIILCCCSICSLSSLKDKYDIDKGHLVECWKNCINVYIACLSIYPSSLKAFRQCSASQIQNRDDTSNMQLRSNNPRQPHGQCAIQFMSLEANLYTG